MAVSEDIQFHGEISRNMSAEFDKKEAATVSMLGWPTASETAEGSPVGGGPPCDEVTKFRVASLLVVGRDLAAGGSHGVR